MAFNETDLSYSFEVQLSPLHDVVQSSGRWETPVEAAKAASEYLMISAENNFTNVMVRVKLVEELGLLGD